MPTRRRLLELLQASDEPRDVHDLAERVGRHPSTVRFHLEVLRTAGVVVRTSRLSSGTGRPRTLYSDVTPESADVEPAYQRLVGLLAANLSDTPAERTERAEKVGSAWAGQLVPRRRRSGLALEDAADRVSVIFADLGFDPQLEATGSGRRITLRACPFRAVAREYPEVVCSIHRELLRATLARLGAQAEVSLHPFVEPEVCVARLDPPDRRASSARAERA